ncbi:MAG: biotin carboxyl carrier domain-containing protein [Chloroflexota bacterium]|nr:biotin carboxyl carrier domain-containing protein [Chloroflexota bacterium]MDE3192998.1 biotin carboxyl carrier domain-containing protein [Chloroflexota bacterium]
MTDEVTRRGVLGLAAELLERLRDPSLRELEVREGGVRVRVAKDEPAIAPAPAPAETVPAAATPSGGHAARAAAPAKAVTAPLTGIFYRSTSPQAPPFVQVGTVVAVGDVIGLIEAMKLFNEVRSTVAGRVLRLVAENGQLVRAHQPLLELE